VQPDPMAYPFGGLLFLVGAFFGVLVFYTTKGKGRTATSILLAFAAASLRLYVPGGPTWAPLVEGAFFTLVPLSLWDYFLGGVAKAGRKADLKVSLWKCVREGEKEEVLKHLKRGADPESPDHEGWTLIHEAARKGHDRILELLLQHGAYRDRLDRFHRTPLHEAAEEGRLACVRVLLEDGADIRFNDSDGRTAAESAKFAGHEKVFKLLDDMKRGLA